MSMNFYLFPLAELIDSSQHSSRSPLRACSRVRNMQTFHEPRRAKLGMKPL